ncbi:hypothetical protein MK407_11840 [Streptococcus sanguinis]|jgi:hypothetical protein|uniref:hypothetical protein n=1 Tax=Streptococcus sanguinis TaxID=1305 RepID=UPI001CBDD111|nr:hypothetical protein [Streptococcus sanguinis]MCC3176401.1 nicotine adenine dinucleotide glycohydrolase family protein [Streptococcus sanguinis]MCY7019949.1 hypothetical protein [Streptococcus sanguinis]MCY7039893.1 hypothetical protein [Streptococcus sanguinis]
MTKYYSNQPDFSTEAPDPAYNYFSSMSDIMDNIEAAGNTVKSEGVEDLYTQKGEAALGVKKDSSIFDKSIQRIYNMLNSAKKVHSDIMQNIDNKFTRGMDDAFKSLNNVNGDKKPYESKYTKKDTIKYKQEAGPNGFEQRAYNDPQPYKLHELLDGKASPIEAAKDVYETRLQAAKAYLAQKDKLTDKEIKNLEGKSAEDIVEAYFPSQIPDYQGLKASRFQEENKDTLQKVDIGLKALAFLAAAGGVIFAPFTSGASLTLTYASGAYLFADNAYSAWTGQTMITGDRLSTEDRVWAGIDAATTLASMGSLAYLTKFGTSGPNLLKNLATLGKYADDANDVSKVFYAAATDQDPSSAIQNLVIGQVASFGVGKASNYFGGKFSRGGTPDLDVDLPGAKASHLDVPLQSKQIPKLDPANVRLSSRPDLHLKASPADTTLAKLKPHPTVSVDVPKVKQVSGDSATKAIGGVKPSDVDVPKVKNNISEPNFANYKEFSTKKIDEFKTNLNDVETKITVETRNAAGEIQRIQLKAVGIDETGKIRIQDYTTAKDGLSIKRQDILDNLSKYGGTIVGEGKGRFTGGTKIEPGTRIEIISQKTSDISIEHVSPEIKKATFAKFDELASREIDWNTAEKQASFKDTFDMYAERAVKEGAVPNKETFYKMYEARQYDYPDVYKEAIKQPYLEGGASSIVNGNSVKNFAFSEKGSSIGRTDNGIGQGNFTTSTMEDSVLLYDEDGVLKSGPDIATVKGVGDDTYSTGMYQYEYTPELVRNMNNQDLIRFPNGDTPGSSSLNIPGAKTWAGSNIHMSESELLMPTIDTRGHSYDDFLSAIKRQGYYEIKNPQVYKPGTNEIVSVEGIFRINQWSN